MRELASGSSLWVLLLLLSPFDGILVPTFGGFYLAITLLFPFIAIRLIAAEKANGGLKLLVQLPYRLTHLIAAKFAAVIAAWLIALIPLISALLWWALLGGHLDAREIATLMLGHLLYALLIGAVSFLAAALTEGGATAAILALSVTIGSWVLDFAALDRGGVSSLLAAVSLTSLLRPFEQGLLSVPTVLGMLIATAGFLALATIWLPPGPTLRRKFKGSILIVVAAGILISGAAQAKTVLDITPDRRNSFPRGDEKLLGQLQDRLLVTVHMASSDPRLVDLDRKVLARLKRAMPRVTILIAEPGQTSPFGTAGDENYGEIVLTYHGKSATTRSTGAGEILPILYELAGAGLPAPGAPGPDEPGCPLVADASKAAIWFYGVQPLAFAVMWWLAAE